MKKSKHQLFTELEDSFNCGNVEQIKNLVSQIPKKGLSHKEKIILSMAYSIMGEVNFAIKYLGKELLLNSDHFQLEIHDLKIQTRLAYELLSTGARYLSKRILDNVLNQAQSANLNLEKSFPLYFKTLAFWHYYSRDFDKAIHHYKLCQEISKDQQLVYLCRQMEALCWYYKGSPDKSLELIEINFGKSLEDQNQFINSMALHYRALFHMELGHYEKAQNLFNTFHQTNKQVGTKDNAYALIDTGSLYCLMENKQSACDYLDKALSQLGRDGNLSKTVIKLFYWMFRSNHEALLFEDHISLRSHHSYTFFPFTLGKNTSSVEKNLMPRSLQSQFIQSENDSWLLCDSSISPLVYQSKIKQIFSEKSEGDFLDLSSSFLSIDGEKSLLSIKDSSILAIIIGSGSLGISSYSLIDFIYRDDLADIEKGEDLLNKVMRRFKKLGIAIERQNNFYKYKHSPGEVIIIPMNYNKVCDHDFLKGHSEEPFSRQELELLYGVSESKASRLIKSWEEQNIITRTGKSKNVRYDFE
ncbi:MAG: hypothetical protein HOE90_06560 [Bacteriovoracaceae bacterium]|jgi:tetratricopeptide (TPR) repeat protein|nr:hypothetical protein [Bacteriovoracaceae bacterium]